MQSFYKKRTHHRGSLQNDVSVFYYEFAFAIIGGCEAIISITEGEFHCK